MRLRTKSLRLPARLEARGAEWPDSIVRGKLGRKASEAILRQCQDDEQPWFILTPQPELARSRRSMTGR